MQAYLELIEMNLHRPLRPDSLSPMHKRLMSLFKVVQVLTLGVLLTACASDVSDSEVRAAANASLPAVPDSWEQVQSTVGEVPIGWIDRIEDPLLGALVAEAQTNNRDLQAAAANVDIANALAIQAGAALTPNLTGIADSTGSGLVEQSGSSSNSAALTLSWEADIWGRISSGEQAALTNAEAAAADYRFSQYSLAAATARSYFLAIEAGLQVAVAQNSLAALTEIDRIVQVQFENGIVNAQDVALSRSDLAATRATLEEALGAQRSAVRALELLLGRYPSAATDLPEALPTVPPLPPAGVPSQILERRPDLVSAERRIASAFNNVNAAEAARLPSVSLTGTLGGSSNQLSDLLNPSNLAWNAASNLVAPLIDGGLRRAQVDQANAEQSQAIASYAQAALNAFEEVETSLDQNQVLLNREVDIAEAAQQAERALEIAQIRYEEGETDLLDVLNIQQRVFNNQGNLVSIERLRLDEWIKLNLALGGSWE